MPRRLPSDRCRNDLRRLAASAAVLLSAATAAAAAQEPARGDPPSSTAPGLEGAGHGGHPRGAEGGALEHAHGLHGAAVPGAAEARVRVDVDSDARVVAVRMGPVHLGQGEMKLTPAHEVLLPVEGWIVAFEARVVDADGADLPAALLHHVNLAFSERRELFMPVMQRLVAAGQETGRIALPWPLGVPIREGEPVLSATMVHNPLDRPVTLYVEARLRYAEPGVFGRVGVAPFYLDVQPPPENAAYDLPPGPSTRSWEGSPAVDARVLALGGHIHAFGREMRLEEVRDDGSTRVLWRAVPEFRDDGRVYGVPRKTFLLRLGVPISADRRYRIVADYHNPTRDTIPGGGMAEIGGIVWPRDAWPDAEATDPAFIDDYRNFTRLNPALRDRLGTPAAPSPHPDAPS